MKKKSLIVIISVVAVLVILSLVVINLVNKNAENQISAMLDEMIEADELGTKYNYKGIEINAAKGLMVIHDLDIINGDNSIYVNSVEIKLPISEAIALAKDSSNATLTDISLIMNDITLISEEIELKQDRLLTHFNGHINSKVFDESYTGLLSDSDFGLKELDIESEGFSFLSEIGNMYIEDLNFKINGNIKPSTLIEYGENSNPIDLVKSLDGLSFNIDNYKFEADEERLSYMTMIASMFIGDVSFMDNKDNWAVEKLGFVSTVSNNRINLEDVSLITNWVNLSGDAFLTLEDDFEVFTPLEINLSMRDYTTDLRPIFQMFTRELTPTDLPEGDFSLSLSMADLNSMPEVVLEGIN